MASIIPGFEYDIFISYRQKDNKHDGWVTEFVRQLKGELESTFKEDISIYFDENPHDRLQDTHNVDLSLEGKLRCLVFIPILSQTYCDPDCFAWQHEFLAFNKLARDDRFGMNIKLKNGNYSSRILPVRIHDIDPEDVKLFEKETGGVLRALDFVFKTSSGVNRPLGANEDHPNDNLNKTFFRDQINKVAHAVKDIISGLKSDTAPTLSRSTVQIVQPDVSKIDLPDVGRWSPAPGRRNLWYTIAAIIVLLFFGIKLIFPGIFPFGKNKVQKDPDGKISIAVNNFENNSNDTTLSWLKMGISELLRNNLALSEELSVQNSQTMNEVYESIGQTNKTSIIPTLSREAAVKLRAGTYVNGSFQKYGNHILTLVKLIDTKSDEVLWTGKAEGDLEQIKDVTDSLSAQLINFLEIKALKQKANPELGDVFTTSSAAYRKYIEGINSLINMDQKSAVISFQEACKIDSNFVLAKFYSGIAYQGLSVFSDIDSRKNERLAAFWIRKTYEYRERLPGNYRLWLEMWYSFLITKNSEEVLKYCGLLEQSDIKSRFFWMDISDTYLILGKKEKALKMFEKIDRINEEWKEDWKHQHFYTQYVYTLHNLGMHEKESKINQKGSKIFPDDPFFLRQTARIALETEKDTSNAMQMLDRLAKKEEWSESRLLRTMGLTFAEIDSINLAEKYYRLALRRDKNDDWNPYSLAEFLVEHDKNINEAVDLLALLQKKYPGVYSEYFYYIRSLGLYKLAKFTEADSLLSIARDSSLTISPDIDKLRKMVKDSLNRRN
jgi:TolB-like protein